MGGEFTLQSKPQKSSQYFIHIGIEKMEGKNRQNSHRNHTEYENLTYDKCYVSVQQEMDHLLSK